MLLQGLASKPAHLHHRAGRGKGDADRADRAEGRGFHPAEEDCDQPLPVDERAEAGAP